MRRVGVLPTLVTLGNGYCGLLAIFKAADALHATNVAEQRELLSSAAVLIFVAMILDLLDGKIARMAGITSRFGAYLDSLSDGISFGVAPAFLAKATAEALQPGFFGAKLLTVLAGLFTMGALLRLARYNVEHAAGEGADSEGRAVTHFDGLPTPGAAGVVAALVFLDLDPKRLLDYSAVEHALPFLCPLLGFLMVSRVPYPHFGNRFLRGREDLRYLFLAMVLIALLVRFPHELLAAGFTLYLLWGPLLWWKHRGQQPAMEMDEPPIETPVSGDGDRVK